MNEESDPIIGATAYALFALQQELDLNGIRLRTAQGKLVSADSDTPEWFAAAASKTASLMETAPELQNYFSAESPHGSGNSDLDLVGMYAPELGALEGETRNVFSSADQQESRRADAPLPPNREDPGAMSIKIGLLKELEEFDT
jgi:hypothetical protein